MKRISVALWAAVLVALGSSGSGAAPTLSGKSLSMSSMSGGASVKSAVPSVPTKSVSSRKMMKTASLKIAPTPTLNVSMEELKAAVVTTPEILPPGATAPGPLVGYSVVEDRPDYSYRPTALKFIEQPTFTTGQIGMGIGPGLPVGTVRYVPVGEF
ncbi:hypothetical protein DYH09_22170 [bacterium CPR1]|nr:hypothetical protein [bacterium CPR1]